MSRGFAGRVKAGLFSAEGGTVLNAYPVVNADALTWDVARYHLQPVSGSLEHEDRGAAEQLLWRLKREHPAACPGHGFAISETPQTVIVPQEWQIPDQKNFHGFAVRRTGTFTLRADDSDYQQVVSTLLKLALRRHMRTSAGQLGPVWQHVGGFCELPRPSSDDPTTAFARRLEVLPATVRGGQWVLKVHLSTVSTDALTIGQYYRDGNVQSLAQRIVLKRENRQTRKLEPTAIRVFVDRPGRPAEMMELAQPELLLEDARLDPASQGPLAQRPVRCQPFKADELEIDANHVRLILDTQITGKAHRETILNVDTRASWFQRVRSTIDGFDAFGVNVKVDEQLYRVPDEHTRVVSLPALRMMVRPGQQGDLPASTADASSIQERARTRSRLLRQNGYLFQYPLTPLLAVPHTWSQARAQRLKRDLNAAARELHLALDFSVVNYALPADILNAAETGKNNAVVAVLPEGSTQPQSPGDMHERIKRLEGMPPSQCIQHDRTLRPHLVETNWNALPNHVAHSVRGRYTLLLQNLVVKCGWLPFTPAEPAHFNVHVGIDVGGVQNNYAMACIGYGLAQAHTQAMFFPQAIRVGGQQAEPIPDSALCRSLDEGFRTIHGRLTELGDSPDFERVLFVRDGDMNGQGETWQEIDGLIRLRAQWVEGGLITADAQWVVAEVSKRAEYWRQLRRVSARVLNPVVGTVSFPFDDPLQALVSTTGDPYLTQGTADPLYVTLTPLGGEIDPWSVMKDLVTEADLCFTKPDHGLSLPWVLHVADKGALHLSRGYYERAGVPV